MQDTKEIINYLGEFGVSNVISAGPANMSRNHELTVQVLHQVNKPTKQSIHCKTKLQIAKYKGNQSISGQKVKGNAALTTSSLMQLHEEGQMCHSKLEEVQTAGQQHNPEGERDRMSQN